MPVPSTAVIRGGIATTPDGAVYVTGFGAIGDTISGGTAGRVLYVGAGPALANSAKYTVSDTAGEGMTIAAGTATTAVNALSVSQTWNAAAVFTSALLDITRTSASNGSCILKLGAGNAGTQAGSYTFATNGAAGGPNYIAHDAVTGQGTLMEFTENHSRVSFIFAKSGGALQLSGTGNIELTPTSLVQFNGTTSSFPALKRNGTTLEVKLADDSAYAPIAIGNTVGAAVGVASTHKATINIGGSTYYILLTNVA